MIHPMRSKYVSRVSIAQGITPSAGSRRSTPSFEVCLSTRLLQTGPPRSIVATSGGDQRLQERDHRRPASGGQCEVPQRGGPPLAPVEGDRLLERIGPPVMQIGPAVAHAPERRGTPFLSARLRRAAQRTVHAPGG